MSRSRRTRVYVAGPYSHGDRGRNVRLMMSVADKLMSLGYAPFNPLLSHYQDAHHHQPYEVWLELDLAWVGVAEALLRMPGYSPGADREVAEAERCGVPVYYDVKSLVGGISSRVEVGSEQKLST